MRAVLECAGIHDVLSKSLGSSNAINIVHATVAALQDARAARRRSRPAAACRSRTSPRPRCCGAAAAAGGGGALMARLKVTQITFRDRRQAEPARDAALLGLKRIGDVVVKEDRPEIRGMVNTVPPPGHRRGGRLT